MKYKIGDRVKIRKDLIVNEYYGKIDFIKDMKKYLGEESVICAIDYKNGREFGYLLKDCDLYTWTDEMLEPIVEYDEEKSSLEKALKLLNMTEEEMNKEYDKKDITELGVEITNKFNNYCNNRWKCRGCKYKEYGKTNCNIMFVLNYLKDKEMLILSTKEDDR